MKSTTEHAFESQVEATLTAKSGWTAGNLSEWDKATAFFPKVALTFIQETQPKVWQEIVDLHQAGAEALVVQALMRELDTKGSLHVLRHGFKVQAKHLKLAYFKPAHGLNPEVLSLYGKNRLTVTRQVPCHPNDNSTMDLVLSVNGLPVATCELKNHATGQSFRNAIRQYMDDRDPRAPLFKEKSRALVHFAADPDEVWMTTRIQGGKTYFLPFNRGSHPGEIRCGAGNPANPNGYRTAYFWEEILQRDSFLDILGHFMFVEQKEEKVDNGQDHVQTVTKKSLIFPRFHQIDAVRKLVRATRTEGAGANYLIQHSAGSGKTNSISWLSHRLASLHNDQDEKLFDCVIVITDRRVLDKQLQDAIFQIEHAQGVVKAIDENARQLAAALVDGTKIVITTLQKFPFVLKGLLHVAGVERGENLSAEETERIAKWRRDIARRKYALIVDEAHSSQTGEASRELRQVLGVSGGNAQDDDVEPADLAAQVAASRGRQANMSFFAFTATPKGKTIEQFGRVGPTGKPEPFHLYSMRQAIEEKFILDVVKNYTTYKVFYKLAKSVQDDPQFPKQRATRALAKFMSLHPHNIEQKTEVIVEHFREKVAHQLGGKAKAMVVSSSRLHAVRYMQAFKRYIQEKGYSDIRPLVAFSGTVKDPDNGLEFTEPGMNLDVVTGQPIGEGQLPERFASPDYQVLLVANKYQTGFDQPLLQAMYVDRRLDGVQAVQTLSRLNRMIPGKSDPFVLDFVNEAEDIYKAFKPYFDATSLQEASDPHMLESLKHELDETQIYYQSEVNAFAAIFYKSPGRQSAADHQRMEKHIQPAVDRYKAIVEPERRTEFRDKLGGYVRVYAFLSQILPYADPELEKLYSFGRFLLRKLPKDQDATIINPGEDVELQYYRLNRIFSGSIDLRDGEDAGVKSPTEVGTGKAKEDKAPLSEIIEVLNDKFGTEFSEADRLFFEQVKVAATQDEQMIQTAMANSFDQFMIGIRRAMERMFIQRLGENDQIVNKYMENTEFQNAAFPILARQIFDTIRAERSSQN